MTKMKEPGSRGNEVRIHETRAVNETSAREEARRPESESAGIARAQKRGNIERRKRSAPRRERRAGKKESWSGAPSEKRAGGESQIHARAGTRREPIWSLASWLISSRNHESETSRVKSLGHSMILLHLPISLFLCANPAVCVRPVIAFQ